MKLRRLSSERPRFEDLNEMLQAMKDLLEGKDTTLTLEELYSFQDQDGSFRLFDSTRIPNEAIIDFVNMPTYLATSILMRGYLDGNKDIKDNLIRGLKFTYKSGFRGHGYDAEKTRIESMNIFIKGRLLEFLEKEKQICPRFHIMIHNIIHEYTSGIIRGKTYGAWGENYKEDWKEIISNIKPVKRLYAAYGSNMNKEQMIKRCLDAKAIGKGYINDWTLTMPHYANIEIKKGSKVPVFVWELLAKDEIILDRYEGYPRCYDKKELIVNMNDVEINATVYVMTDMHMKRNIEPREGYREEIIQGYKDAEFSEGEFRPR